ncbi:MAG: nucleotidyltransferase family protein, partial [Gemmatimonadales bacterium]
MPTLRDDLRNAIQLRRWAWAALNGRPAPAPPATPRAWRLFLDREACAMALARMPGLELPEPVRRRAQLESQQILLARAELAAVARAVTSAGLEVIPLKGTRALLTPTTALALKDVDVLAHPGATTSTEEALESAGFGAARSRSYLHVVLARPGTSTPVELHGTIWPQAALTSADLWTAAIPDRAIPGLRALDSTDHLWLCLVHVVAVHPDRAGRLRDLLVIRAAHAECSAAQVEIVSTRMADHPMATALQAELDRAVDRDTDQDRSNGDRIAATWYTLDALVARTPIGTALRMALSTWASMIAASSVTWQMMARRLLAAGGTSRLRPVALLERRLPPLGHLARVAIRLIWI